MDTIKERSNEDGTYNLNPSSRQISDHDEQEEIESVDIKGTKIIGDDPHYLEDYDKGDDTTHATHASSSNVPSPSKGTKLQQAHGGKSSSKTSPTINQATTEKQKKKKVEEKKSKKLDQIEEEEDKEEEEDREGEEEEEDREGEEEEKD